MDFVSHFHYCIQGYSYVSTLSPFYYTVATPEETPTNEVTGDGAEDDEEWPDLG